MDNAKITTLGRGDERPNRSDVSGIKAMRADGKLEILVGYEEL